MSRSFEATWCGRTFECREAGNDVEFRETVRDWWRRLPREDFERVFTRKQEGLFAHAGQ